MRASLKKIFLARYVLLAEVLGYGIAFLLLSLWIMFFFIHKDEYCFAPGIIKPATIDIESPKKAVFLEVFAKDGQWVRKGQELYRLNLDTKAIAARQAQADLSSLGEQVITLATNPSDRAALEQSVSEIIREVGQLETGASLLTLSAPEAGLLSHALPTTSMATQPVVEGSLGRIVSDQILRFEGDMGELNRRRVEVGMPIRLEARLDQGAPAPHLGQRIGQGIKKVIGGALGKKDPLIYKIEGKVVELPGGSRIVAQAPVANEKIAQMLSNQILNHGQGDDPLKAEAKVVVGNVRLVTYLFKRSEAAAKKPEKKTETKEVGK